MQRHNFVSSEELTLSGLATQPASPVEKVVIFLHGTPGSADAWIDTLMQAPSDILAIAIDRPGYGETKPKKAMVSLEAQAQALAALLESDWFNARTQNPMVALIGHSLGGPIVAQAGLLYPDKIDAIIIAAGALDPDLEDVHWAQKLATVQPFKFLIGHTLRTANAELLGLEAELRRLEPQWAQLKVPVFIIHGTEDSLVPYANVAFMKKMMPEDMICQPTIIEGGDHFLPWNAMDDLWAAVGRINPDGSVSC